jgi:hypothetical protein
MVTIKNYSRLGISWIVENTHFHKGHYTSGIVTMKMPRHVIHQTVVKREFTNFGMKKGFYNNYDLRLPSL